MKEINFSQDFLEAIQKVISPIQVLSIPEVLIDPKTSEVFNNLLSAMVGLQNKFDLGDLAERVAISQKIISGLNFPFNEPGILEKLSETFKLMESVTKKNSIGKGAFSFSAGGGNINYSTVFESSPDFHPLYSANIRIVIE